MNETARTAANPRELTQRVCAATGQSAPVVNAILDAYRVSIGGALVAGEPVSLPLLGTFKVKPTPARRGTVAGRTYDKPAGRRVVFTPSVHLRQAVDETAVA